MKFEVCCDVRLPCLRKEILRWVLATHKLKYRHSGSTNLGVWLSHGRHPLQHPSWWTVFTCAGSNSTQTSLIQGSDFQGFASLCLQNICKTHVAAATGCSPAPEELHVTTVCWTSLNFLYKRVSKTQWNKLQISCRQQATRWMHRLPPPRSNSRASLGLALSEWNRIKYIAVKSLIYWYLQVP